MNCQCEKDGPLWSGTFGPVGIDKYFDIKSSQYQFKPLRHLPCGVAHSSEWWISPCCHPGIKRCLYLPSGIEYQSPLVRDHRTYPFSTLLFETAGIRTAESTQHCLLYVLFMGLCHLGFSFNSFPVSAEPCAASSLVKKPPCKSNINSKGVRVQLEQEPWSHSSNLELPKTWS